MEAFDMEKVRQFMKEEGMDVSLDDVEVDPEETVDAMQMEQLAKLMEGFRNKVASQPPPGVALHWTIYMTVFVLFFGVIGLFSYRLIQSLSEKEKKREEKRKLKEMKKKK